MNLVRLTVVALLAAASLGAHAAENIPPAQPPALATVVSNSVVKVFSTLRRPDPLKPWTKAAPSSVSGSGVVIEGKRILTNAHVVGYASQVEVQASQSGDKMPATVVAISRGMDLALLKLDDESFFDTHPPVPRAKALPDVGEAVFAYGYPIGGNSLSTTKGVISRIEFVPYGYGNSGLRIQVDAPINPGNSGGAVVVGDKLAGLAFSGVTNAQNIGYIIPNEEIELFLKNVAAGQSNDKLSIHDDMQTLENPVLRQFLKLDKSIEGLVVSHPAGKDAGYPLKEWDVVTHIGQYPIDNQGMVKLGQNLRVRFQYHLQHVARDGKVPLTIVRAGKTMQVQVPVSGPRKLLIPDLNGGYPSYFVYGPIVFSRATAEYLSFLSANAPALNAFSFNANPLVTRRGDQPDAEHDELVVIAAPFFPHKLVNGYGPHFASVVDSVNGVHVKSLRHLVQVLRDLKDENVVLRFDQRYGETMVLPRKAMLDATDGILQDNGIRMQGSPDMMEVWNGKSA
ncbi:trypsin-like peptidase domain-containing protein [Massilia agilis]|uniref:Trypsin-like peptidase domain-containing protein n=1 Tax=Massilia agilis TaxID=1811226 RepID=A0ABT2DDA8_9BURK|nr:trypsin-like peptidase domain-containing protein [Massilia agilis]MCS0809310.1 trypsin-like peptidase domain-containing protein [Massilia agilis]